PGTWTRFDSTFPPLPCTRGRGEKRADQLCPHAQVSGRVRPSTDCRHLSPAPGGETDTRNTGRRDIHVSCVRGEMNVPFFILPFIAGGITCCAPSVARRFCAGPNSRYSRAGACYPQPRRSI